MNVASAFALARHNLARGRRAAASAAFGVAVGVASLVFFVALGSGLSEVVRTRVLPVDHALVEVVQPRVSLGSLLGGGGLDDEAVRRFSELPGVEAALPKMNVRVSAVSRYNGDFFGRPLRFGMEIMAVGVDPRLVQGDVAAGRRFADAGEDAAMPVLISTRLLEIYNGSFAVQRNLPRLSPDLLTGFRFPVEFGRSYIAAVGREGHAAQLEVVGFSPRALLGGVTLPLEVARRINRSHGVDDRTYSSVVLRAASPDRVPEVAAAVRRMGFEIDDTEKTLAEQAGFGILAVTLGFALLSLLVTLLAAFNVSHAFRAAAKERRREIGILRAVGAARADVLRLFLAEAALVGLAGSAAGLLAGVGAASLVDVLAARVLPEFAFRPESWFLFPPWLLAGALLLGTVSALAGALLPAAEAAGQDPVAALAE